MGARWRSWLQVSWRILVEQEAHINLSCLLDLDDAAGATSFLQGIQDLIDYNQAVSANERFVGLQADIEPQDQGA